MKENPSGSTSVESSVNPTKSGFTLARNSVNRSNVNDKYLPDGSTLLHTSSKLGNKEDTEYLISLNADVNSEDNNGRTPLFFAVKAQNEVIVNILINAGADPTAASILDGVTPLDMAYASGNASIINSLKILEVAGNVQPENTEKYAHSKPQSDQNLFKAINKKDISKIKTLVPTINIHNQNENGDNAVSFARKNKYFEIAELLISEYLINYSNFNDIDKQNGEGATLLHLAVETGNLDIIKKVIEKILETGGSFVIKDNNGKIPLDWLVDFMNDDDQPEQAELYAPIFQLFINIDQEIRNSYDLHGDFLAYEIDQSNSIFTFKFTKKDYSFSDPRSVEDIIYILRLYKSVNFSVSSVTNETIQEIRRDIRDLQDAIALSREIDQDQQKIVKDSSSPKRKLDSDTIIQPAKKLKQDDEKTEQSSEERIAKSKGKEKVNEDQEPSSSNPINQKSSNSTSSFDEEQMKLAIKESKESFKEYNSKLIGESSSGENNKLINETEKNISWNKISNKVKGSIIDAKQLFKAGDNLLDLSEANILDEQFNKNFPDPSGFIESERFQELLQNIYDLVKEDSTSFDNLNTNQELEILCQMVMQLMQHNGLGLDLKFEIFVEYIKWHALEIFQGTQELATSIVNVEPSTSVNNSYQSSQDEIKTSTQQDGAGNINYSSSLPAVELDITGQTQEQTDNS